MQTPETEIIVTKDGAEILRKTVQPGDYVIGREPGCDLHVDVELVSRRHAQLTVNFDHALIEDLGSSNGTFINGQPVMEATRLWPNQKIQVGAVTVELRRIRTLGPPDVSLAPQTAAVQRLLPEEFLREKKYDIGKVVAQGGMGAILDATDVTTERRVAMKVMLDGSNPNDLVRFVAEAKVTAQLEHPSIVPVYELSVDENGQVFYTMKMVRGITMRKVLELLAEGVEATVKKYPLSALLTIFQKVCDALAFAHSKGVIHRDLKPENIMLDDFGVVLVMDWGLAKIIGKADAVAPGATQGGGMASLSPEASGATLAGTVMGTPQYMSPEQARGEVESLDARSDIYALGTILYHILTLRPPVSGDDAWAIVEKVTKGEVEPLTPPRPGRFSHLPGRRVPDGIAAVVRKAMAFDRAKRYAGVADLQSDLEAYQDGRATSAENAGVGKQLFLLVKRHKLLATSVALIFTLVAGFLVKVVNSERKGARLLERLRGTAPTFQAQARSFLDNGRTKDALEKIAFALELAPGNSDYLRLQADALETDQQFAAAAEAYRRVLVQRPNDGVAMDNFTLCEDLRQKHPDGTGLTVVDFNALYALVAREQRAESHVFGALAGKKKEAYGTLITARLKPLMQTPQWTGNRLLHDASGGWSLSLVDFPLSNLEILRDLPLEGLRLDGTGAADISALAGMPLKALSCGGLTKLTDLSPLRGAPLEDANFNKTGITDLRAFAGMPLRKLSLSETRVIDLGPLHGLLLEELNLTNSPATSLEPLRGMKLRKLWIYGSAAFTDLTPLAGMPLEELHGDNNRLHDISALAGMPLRELYIRVSRVKDVAPLATCRELRILSIPDGCVGVEVLRQLPKLSQIITGGSQTADEFWKAYDTKHPVPAPK